MNARRFALLVFDLLASMLTLVVLLTGQATAAQGQPARAPTSLGGDQPGLSGALPMVMLIGDMMNDGHARLLGDAGSGGEMRASIAQLVSVTTNTPTSTDTPLPVCTMETSTPYPTATDYPTPHSPGGCPFPPSQTPYPTSTPYPCPSCPTSTPTRTYTPSDTPTNTPTYTSTVMPTDTPYPTPTNSSQCILETVTPNPTYTPRSSPTPTTTFTPCTNWPTFTALPTYTPYPTYTPTPTTCPGCPPPPTPTLVPTSTPTCVGDWEIVGSPNPEPNASFLSGVAAISSNDVWAIGHYSNRTLTLHWDGLQWTQIPSPNHGTDDSLLVGMDAISSNDIWAVGSYDISNGSRTLTEHWDGSQWSIVPSANSDSVGSHLGAVSAVSTNDVWAVGYSNGQNYSHFQTLIEHWNGEVWSVVPSPNVGTEENVLSGVTAISANDAWAVGEHNATRRTLTEHWDGSQWTIVLSPDPFYLVSAELSGVDAVSSNNVWAVGDYVSISGYDETLIEHWNGNTWDIVPSPNSGDGSGGLSAVVAISSNDVWAVGYSSTYVNNLLVEHWDAQQWSVVPNADSPGYQLSAVSASSIADVWGVGSGIGYYQQTLTEHYTAQCPPSPTLPPTATGTSSNTPITTFTTTATPTVCSVQFTDVLPGSTFYPYVQCMACLGIIDGYSSGCETGSPCFRPDRFVTRGQLSKIVSNSAGFQEPPGAQRFDDVLPGSTFYDYIQRLASRSYISGYPCGGEGEPCGPANLPYFRPGGNATRGQISKIVSNAAGYDDTPGDQQFVDVPPGSTFYDYIERLASRGVMNGYQCGGDGEPCGPTNLPYFRPVNNATRGQASKIVTNTFFPACGAAQRRN